MRDKILSKLDLLDQKLASLIDALEVYSEEDLQKKPGPEVWSPAQLICHMRLVEETSMAYLKKKLSYDPVLNKVGILHVIKSKVKLLALGFASKISAPKGVDEGSFPAEITYADEAKKWKQLRLDTRNYLSTLDEKWLDKDAYKHPFAGRLSIGQMLDFFAGHFERHRKQLMGRLPE